MCERRSSDGPCSSKKRLPFGGQQHAGIAGGAGRGDGRGGCARGGAAGGRPRRARALALAPRRRRGLRRLPRRARGGKGGAAAGERRGAPAERWRSREASSADGSQPDEPRVGGRRRLPPRRGLRRGGGGRRRGRHPGSPDIQRRLRVRRRRRRRLDPIRAVDRILIHGGVVVARDDRGASHGAPPVAPGPHLHAAQVEGHRGEVVGTRRRENPGAGPRHGRGGAHAAEPRERRLGPGRHAPRPRRVRHRPGLVRGRKRAGHLLRRRGRPTLVQVGGRFHGRFQNRMEM